MFKRMLMIALMLNLNITPIAMAQPVQIVIPESAAQGFCGLPASTELLRLERTQREFFEALGWGGDQACEDLVLALDADIAVEDPNALIAAHRDNPSDSFHFRVTGAVAFGEWEEHLPADEAADIYSVNGAAGFVIGSIPTGGASSIEFHGMYLAFDDPEGAAPRSRWLMVLDWRPVAEPIHIACDGDIDGYTGCANTAWLDFMYCVDRANGHFKSCLVSNGIIGTAGSALACLISKGRFGKAALVICGLSFAVAMAAAYGQCKTIHNRDIKDWDI